MARIIVRANLGFFARNTPLGGVLAEHPLQKEASAKTNNMGKHIRWNAEVRGLFAGPATALEWRAISYDSTII